ncbi:MAG: hypothetical protein ACPG5T_08535, partial [Endozoicomonas sp.]
LEYSRQEVLKLEETVKCNEERETLKDQRLKDVEQENQRLKEDHRKLIKQLADLQVAAEKTSYLETHL